MRQALKPATKIATEGAPEFPPTFCRSGWFSRKQGDGEGAKNTRKTIVAAFQDRCLQPLGHPSGVVMSAVYVRRTARPPYQTGQSPRNESCLRPAVRPAGLTASWMSPMSLWRCRTAGSSRNALARIERWQGSGYGCSRADRFGDEPDDRRFPNHTFPLLAGPSENRPPRRTFTRFESIGRKRAKARQDHKRAGKLRGRVHGSAPLRTLSLRPRSGF
jgi:hypothetical protein